MGERKGGEQQVQEYHQAEGQRGPDPAQRAEQPETERWEVVEVDILLSTYGLDHDGRCGVCCQTEDSW